MNCEERHPGNGRACEISERHSNDHAYLDHDGDRPQWVSWLVPVSEVGTRRPTSKEDLNGDVLRIQDATDERDGTIRGVPRGLVRRDHPTTSQDAADDIGPRINDGHEAVLAALREAPHGLTDEQLIDATGLGPSTERPRRVELVQAGFVVDSGGTRSVRSGKSAIVWILTPKEAE